ncbi:MAG: replicative DNA helicase, partial [Firmicutes bacterium]|nr:replicative DNA helicase [Candidatus Colimorpha enterica]
MSSVISDSLRKLPYSQEAEQSVLGAVIIDPMCLPDVMTKIKSDEFYIEVNRVIYISMMELQQSNRTIDPVTLLDAVESKEIFKTRDEANSYIRILAELVPSSSNIDDYCRIIHDKFILRCLISTCEDVTDKAYSETDSAPKILDAAQQALFNIADSNETHGFVHIRDALTENYNYLKTLKEDPQSVQGQKTGYSQLDRVLVGLAAGNVVIVGARPGMGKTSFAMNMATNIARRSNGKAVCVFSLEMSTQEIVSRMLSSEALVDSMAIRSGNLSEDDYYKLAQASSMLAETNILIDDTAGITVAGMRAKLRKVRDQIGLIVVDYLQLMQADGKNDNRVQAVGEISRGLKLLAKDLKVPIICCAQLSRGTENRESKRPMLSDLRESGSIEMDADVVIFLYREDYYGENKDPSAQSTAKIIVAKNRHGSTGDIEMG